MKITLNHDGRICAETISGHTVLVPPNGAGMQGLLTLLSGEASGAIKLGQPGALTQAQLDEIIKLWENDRPAPQVDLTGIEL